MTTESVLRYYYPLNRGNTPPEKVATMKVRTRIVAMLVGVGLLGIAPVAPSLTFDPPAPAPVTAVEHTADEHTADTDTTLAGGSLRLAEPVASADAHWYSKGTLCSSYRNGVNHVTPTHLGRYWSRIGNLIKFRYAYHVAGGGVHYHEERC